MQRETLTVTEAAVALGISRNLCYEMVRQGKIPSLRFGKRIVVPRQGIEKLLEDTRNASSPHS
jgi:excisionase family DNA binding protein